MRNLSNPSAGSTLIGVLPAASGGTGKTTPTLASTALTAIPSAQRNAANGVAIVDSSGKMLVANIPAESFSLISINGPTSVMKGLESQYLITNYDTFTNYVVEAVLGSVSVFDSIITYTAPLVTGAAGFTVNGRQYTVNITDTAPLTPSITSPTGGASLIDTAYTFTSSAFATVDGGSTHSSSDWEISTDSGFNTISKTTTNDVVSKTNWSVIGLNNKATYFIRTRQKSSSNVYSAWSPTVTFSVNIVGASVYSAVARTGSGASASINQATFAPDLMIGKRRAAGAGTVVYDKVRGPTNLLLLNSTNAETTGANKGVISFDNNGISFGSASDANINQSGQSEILYFFKRLSSIFDIAAFTGSTVNHNLGVKPELIISKNKDSAATSWNVFCKPKASNNIIDNSFIINSLTVTNAGTGYTAMPTVSFSGGGGSGAAASITLANDGTVSRQTGSEWILPNSGSTGVINFIGYDYTSLPALGTWSGPLTVNPSASASFVTLYDYSTGIDFTSYIGTPLPDGTYTETGINPFLSSLIAPTLQITVSAGVIVSSSIINIGLTANGTHQAFFYFNHPTISGSYIYCRMSAGTTSPRKGVNITAFNGSSQTQDAIATLTYSGGGGNGSGSTSFTLNVNNPIYSNVPAYKVNSITLTNAGSGYTATPTVTITGDGYGAAATVNTTLNNVNTPTVPTVTNIVLEGTAGSIVNKFFSGEPTPTVFKTIAGASDKVLAINILNKGTGYVTAPTVSITGGGGTGATAIATILDGGIDTIEIVTTGSGYSSIPTVALTGGSGTGASAAALLGNGLSNNYISYLLATFAEVSKVFSYKGNGNNLDIDCGFLAGAKFIFIVRTDAAGDRYVWDSTRGITSGNDPHISLNDTTSAEITTDDSIGLLNIGFTAKQNTATNINVLNATYIGFAFS